MDPIDALNQALFLGLHRRRQPRYAAPGAIVASLPEETRRALRQLTPAHLAVMRAYPEDSAETQARREVSRLKRAFDARCSRLGMSILSDEAIETALAAGLIKIEPFEPKHLNPTSYDVTLHSSYLVYDHWKEDPHRVYDPYHAPKVTRHEIPPEGVDLFPGQSYLMATAEKIGSTVYAPRLDGKSSVARLFVSVHETAESIHPGSYSNITLEVTVQHPIRLYAGMRIGQIRFETVEGKIRRLYDQTGHYTGTEGTTGPVASRLHQQLQERPKAGVFGAVCVLVRKDPEPRILAVTRRHARFDLNLPGGKVDRGENPKRAALRELFEETGIQAKDAELIHTADVAPGEPVQVYLVRTWEGEARCCEKGITPLWVPYDYLEDPACTFAAFNRDLRARLIEIFDGLI